MVLPGPVFKNQQRPLMSVCGVCCSSANLRCTQIRLGLMTTQTQTHRPRCTPSPAGASRQAGGSKPR